MEIVPPPPPAPTLVDVGVTEYEHGGGIVYTALATSLAVQPVLNARALSVRVSLTATGPEYALDPAVGSAPSVVYVTLAPDVIVEIVTSCAELYCPVPGLNVGAAAFSSYAALAIPLA